MLWVRHANKTQQHGCPPTPQGPRKAWEAEAAGGLRAGVWVVLIITRVVKSPCKEHLAAPPAPCTHNAGSNLLPLAFSPKLEVSLPIEAEWEKLGVVTAGAFQGGVGTWWREWEG